MDCKRLHVTRRRLLVHVAVVIERERDRPGPRVETQPIRCREHEIDCHARGRVLAYGEHPQLEALAMPRRFPPLEQRRILLECDDRVVDAARLDDRGRVANQRRAVAECDRQPDDLATVAHHKWDREFLDRRRVGAEHERELCMDAIAAAAHRERRVHDDPLSNGSIANDASARSGSAPHPTASSAWTTDGTARTFKRVFGGCSARSPAERPLERSRNGDGVVSQRTPVRRGRRSVPCAIDLGIGGLRRVDELELDLRRIACRREGRRLVREPEHGEQRARDRRSGDDGDHAATTAAWAL